MSQVVKRILVIGGASFDILHLEDQTVESIGGVGMYTAMAAHRCGVEVTMLGPRSDPTPDLMQPVAVRLKDWFGPLVSPDQLPGFEISYQGGKTDYLEISLGAAVTAYSPEILPPDLSQYDLVHVAQKADIKMQLSLIKACRQRGAKQVSAGTYPLDASENPGFVRTILEQSDYFFMNDFEAQAVFGSLDAAQTQPGKVLFITMGRKGVRILQGDFSTTIPAVATKELDPTGAGDTFCGATLANLAKIDHPILAARKAVGLAAEMIAYVGPTALFFDDPPPEIYVDPRVGLNEEQVDRVAEVLSRLPEVTPFSFTGLEYPPLGDPKTIDFFFAATLQQFGFWREIDGRYHKPLIAQIKGKKRKGSDYLWASFKRQHELDDDYCSPAQQAKLTRKQFLEFFRTDDGKDPMPALDLHLEIANRYGQDMLALQLTPQSILEEALASPDTLQTFIAYLDQVGGYKDDPLRKKSSLLALILNQRPEHFLPLQDIEKIPPVIDYHLMRSFLRIGLVEVSDGRLEDMLLRRQLVSSEDEWAVRFAAYRAMQHLVDRSGKSEGAVDYYFFNARKRCPEMSEPDCAGCQIDPVCAHRKTMFQPVFRTSNY